MVQFRVQTSCGGLNPVALLLFVLLLSMHQKYFISVFSTVVEVWQTSQGFAVPVKKKHDDFFLVPIHLYCPIQGIAALGAG